MGARLHSEGSREGSGCSAREPVPISDEVEGGESSDAAQSLVADAQRFLVERLETLSETRGRFEANVRLPIPCGANPYLEVGLLSRRDRLAVMFDSEDGLGDAERYRLARREDWLLQKNGYRVFRLLAEDICVRLDATLDFIFQTVVPSV